MGAGPRFACVQTREERVHGSVVAILSGCIVVRFCPGLDCVYKSGGERESESTDGTKRQQTDKCPIGGGEKDCGVTQQHAGTPNQQRRIEETNEPTERTGRGQACVGDSS